MIDKDAQTPRPSEVGEGSTPIAARVVTPAADQVRPLYATSRLLRGEILEAEGVLAEAREARSAAEAECAQLLADARAEAQGVLQAARDSADEVRARALEEGRRAAGGEVQKLLNKAVAEVERARGVFPQEVQRTAFRFAKAILDVEFAVRPERVVELVESVLERARQYRQIRIHLHPLDLPLVEQARKQLEDRLTLATELRLLPDEELERQGVVIETEMGTYLGSVDEQLRPLREHLRLSLEASNASDASSESAGARASDVPSGRASDESEGER